MDVLNATSDYQEEQDFVGEFILESCVIGPSYKVRSKDLFAAYREFCNQSGEKSVLGRRQFGESLTKRGLARYTSNGAWYRGIGLSEVRNGVTEE